APEKCELLAFGSSKSLDLDFEADGDTKHAGSQ
nr:hypothetical protein [Tanacetum cinerariifolium]